MVLFLVSSPWARAQFAEVTPASASPPAAVEAKGDADSPGTPDADSSSRATLLREAAGRASPSRPAGEAEVPPAAPALIVQPKQPRPHAAGFQWDPALRQSFQLLLIEHAFRLATEQGTRDELRGPFLRDWLASASNLRGWRDGDPAMVNYVGHPMQGAVTGFIQIQNSPGEKALTLAWTPQYRRSRLKAFLWSAVFEAQFELGPLSESSIGNVGRVPTPKSSHPQSYVDLVITPAVGTAWLVGEDALDRYVVRRVEAHTSNRFWVGMSRSLLNPARSFANLMAWHKPWHRDDRQPGLRAGPLSATTPAASVSAGQLSGAPPARAPDSSPPPAGERTLGAAGPGRN
jgi:hypothetical protein